MTKFVERMTRVIPSAVMPTIAVCSAIVWKLPAVAKLFRPV